MSIVPPERWPAVAALFDEALMLPSAERLAFVEQRTNNPDLRSDLRRLLAAHEHADDFLDSLDARHAAALLEEPGASGIAIGRYEVVRRLGRGGMGVVYLAHDPRLDRLVAIKLLPARVDADEHARQRFADEARAASALDHPHICTIYEIDETPEGHPYIAMAYYEGGTLAQRQKRSGDPIPIAEAVALGVQVSDALAAAHARGLVHCDVKPANVVLTGAGTAKVVDFGIARMLGTSTASGFSPGTPAYMSPEQMNGGTIDARCDVWSLGVMLYELLAGRRPFIAPYNAAMRARFPFDPAAPLRERRPGIPAELDALVLRCVEKDPERRPADAGAVLEELRRIASTMSSGAAQRSWPPRIRLVASAVAMLAVVAVATAAWLQSRSSSTASDGTGTTLAIMPFATATDDTALARLGRELAVTVGASLAGTGDGGVRTAEPTTILALVPGAAPTLALGAAIARDVGARYLTHGTIVRDGAGVSLQLGVFASADNQPLARFAVTVPTDSISSVSDSVALAILRSAWPGSGVVPPSLAVLRTGSVPALRAYLDGEQAMARGNMRLAPQRFAEAISLDSTFWYARWRYMYARSWHGEPVDSATVAAVYAHKGEFPEPDRLLIELSMTRGASARLDLAGDITRRFPDYWPGWFELADQLVHQGGYLGHPASEAQVALERSAALNPRFVPAWEHLLWIALREPDSTTAMKALNELERFRSDSVARREWGLETLAFYRYLVQLLRTDGAPDPELTKMGVEDLATTHGAIPAERFAADLSGYGFHRAQLALSAGVRASDGPDFVRAAHWWAEAVARTGLGDWAGSLDAATRYAREAGGRSDNDVHAALWSYGLAASGVWLGGLPASDIAMLREAAAKSPAARTSAGHAELAWLDGLVAAARGDRAALRTSRETLLGMNDGTAPTLARSLHALDTAVAGDTATAARSLAALEWQMADSGWAYGAGPDHPFLNAVHRITASRWLEATGDSAQAARLRLWRFAVLPGRTFPLEEINQALGDAAFR